MIRLRVQARRRAFAMADSNNEDIWLCESCGETEEEGLVVYEIVRVTRAVPDGSREACLCASCESRVPHGVVISD